jgi:hypothetical protein
MRQLFEAGFVEAFGYLEKSVASQGPATSRPINDWRAQTRSSGRPEMIRGVLLASVAFAASCSGAFSQAAYSPLTIEAAQRRLEAYVDTWSANRGINAANVGHYYADRVIYYGKPMSRQAVLRDKLNYIAVWPERHYRIVPGTVSAACNPQQTACRVSGLMAWDRRSISGRESIGRARLTLVLSRESGGRIVRESASLPITTQGRL